MASGTPALGLDVAGAHHWAREIAKMDHHVRLIAPAYVKPFIKRQKNDAADAEAICEAAQWQSLPFVPVKTEEQQANGIVFRAGPAASKAGQMTASDHAQQRTQRFPLPERGVHR